jgi:hypothetical protein
MRLALLAMVASLACGAELPVTRVIVYKNGLAYFERSGDVNPAEPAQLQFKASEMDDVLKSLVLEGPAGGTVKRLRYEMNEPPQKRLGEVAVPLPTQQPLALLLDQCRGSRVEIKIGSTQYAGTIVSGRLALLPQQGQKQEITLLLDSGELTVLDLGSAQTVKFSDAKLEAQLREALSVLDQTRSREKRSLLVETQGMSKLTAHYLVPAPVWKSSYRMLLRDAGEASLEGWALIDNASGEDWNNVDLAVVSGKPVSFISRLYEPRYVQRAEASLPEDQAAAPIVHTGAMAPAPTPPPALKKMALGTGRRDEVMSRDAAAPSSMAEMVTLSGSALGPEAEGIEAGELFEYKFTTPVTAKKGESAMLPFVQQKIAARQLLIYADRSSAHPRNAAELANNTGKTLDGGPITVYSAGGYAGEALMETLKPGDKRLISYSIDLGTRVTTSFESGSEITRSVKASRGVLTIRTAVERTTTYNVNNVDAKEKTLIIEQPAIPSMKVVRPKADETTTSANRFSVRLPASGAQKLAVVEEEVLQRTEAVSNIGPDQLLLYVQNGQLSPAAKQQLQAVAEKRRGVADADAETKRIEAEMAEITRDQDRIRQNLNSLNRVSGQQEMVQRYATELAKGDASMISLRDRLAEVRKRRAALEAELNSLVEKLEF